MMYLNTNPLMLFSGRKGFCWLSQNKAPRRTHQCCLPLSSLCSILVCLSIFLHIAIPCVSRDLFTATSGRRQLQRSGIIPPSAVGPINPMPESAIHPASLTDNQSLQSGLLPVSDMKESNDHQNHELVEMSGRNYVAATTNYGSNDDTVSEFLPVPETPLHEDNSENLYYDYYFGRHIVGQDGASDDYEADETINVNQENYFAQSDDEGHGQHSNSDDDQPSLYEENLSVHEGTSHSGSTDAETNDDNTTGDDDVLHGQHFGFFDRPVFFKENRDYYHSERNSDDDSHEDSHDDSHDHSHDHSHDDSHDHSHDDSHDHSHDDSLDHSHDDSHDDSHDHSHEEEFHKRDKRRSTTGAIVDSLHDSLNSILPGIDSFTTPTYNSMKPFLKPLYAISDLFLGPFFSAPPSSRLGREPSNNRHHDHDHGHDDGYSREDDHSHSHEDDVDPICCEDCESHDHSCLASCDMTAICYHTDTCKAAGEGVYAAFCQRACAPPGSMMGMSAHFPEPACRGLCAATVQNMCVANACEEYGCSVKNCASTGAEDCG